MKALLVEPNYPTKYPPVALLKIGAMLKARGDEATILKGRKRDVGFEPDEIWITSFATYFHKVTIETIRFYKAQFPKAEIKVGGVFASLMPDHIERYTGIKPHVGLIEEAEAQVPDYSLFETDISVAYTSRGCTRKCPWCVVPVIEGDLRHVDEWWKMVDPKKPFLYLLDNNWFAKDIKLVLEDAKILHRLVSEGVEKIDFNQGLDARLFTEEIAQALEGLPFEPIRFAFDSMAQDQHCQRAIGLAQKYGLSRKQEWKGSGNPVLIYTLYNHKGRPENFYYRIREIIRCGGQPYPMQFSPHDDLERKYVGKHWTKRSRDNVKHIATETSYGRGQISSVNREEFEYYWGKDEKEFLEIINLPGGKSTVGAKRDSAKIERIRKSREKS